MKGADLYLKRYAWPESLIEEIPDEDLAMAVVVPAYNEPHLISSLATLARCEQPACAVEVIAVLNYPEDSSKEIVENSLKSFEQIGKWSKVNSRPGLRFFPIWAGGLKKKFAGPGLARKIGMDEAVRRIYQLGKENGLVVSFDADCSCDANYLVEIYNLFKSKRAFNGCAVYYEHYPLQQENHLTGHIVNYELHLRYYSDALQFAGYPYPFHTIGSTMVVTAKAYIATGGMNRRKAGEDFFFLQKIFPMGGFYYLNSTTVYPSPRVSDRVPFGTGATMTKLESSNKYLYPTYNLQSFFALRDFLILKDRWYYSSTQMANELLDGLPQAMQVWLRENDFPGQLQRIRSNAASQETFLKAFFQWFNRFNVLKYVHFARDQYYPNIDVKDAVNGLMEHLNIGWDKIDDRKELLLALRRYDKEEKERCLHASDGRGAGRHGMLE